MSLKCWLNCKIDVAYHTASPVLIQLSCSSADLKAFERRLTEYVSCLQPATGRWRSKSGQIFIESFSSSLKSELCLWSKARSVHAYHNNQQGLKLSLLWKPDFILWILSSFCSDSDRGVCMHSHRRLELADRSRHSESMKFRGARLASNAAFCLFALIVVCLLCPFFPQVSFFSSLWNHPFFTISCVTLIGLFFAGIHKRVVAPSMYPS